MSDWMVCAAGKPRIEVDDALRMLPNRPKRYSMLRDADSKAASASERRASVSGHGQGCRCDALETHSS